MKPFSRWLTPRPCRPCSFRRRGYRPRVECLEDRTLLSTITLPETEPNDTRELALASKNIIPVNVDVAGSIASPGDVDYYVLPITEPGMLQVRATPATGSSLALRLALANVDSYVHLGPLPGGGGG